MERFRLAIHHHFFWLLIASYVIAGFVPGPGLGIRNISIGTFGGTKLTLPMAMLSLLLFNAGLGIRATAFDGLRKRTTLLGDGLLGNLLLPLTFILAISALLRFWHNPDEVQNILVGLALIASM